MKDIISEASILKYLSNINQGSNNLAKYIHFFHDNHNYFLLTQYGGQTLLQHVIDLHKNIFNNVISIKEFKRHVKVIFKQMVKFVYWLHVKAKVVHLNINLKNSMYTKYVPNCYLFIYK